MKRYGKFWRRRQFPLKATGSDMEFVGLLIIIGLIMFIHMRVSSKYTLKNLTYECRFSCVEACEGDEILLIETLTNQKWLPIPWLKAELNTSRWLEFAGSQSVVTDKTRFVPSFFMIGGYKKVERAWKVKCLKRGRFEVEAVLVSTDLFGAMSLSASAKITAAVTVLPRPYEFQPIAPSAKQMLGDIIVKRHLISDPFMISGVREYTERDPVNKIHWSATAKAGRIMVRNNDYTSQQNICVILNMQSRAFEKFDVIEKERIEDGIRVCARLFDDALLAGMPVCFLSNATLSLENAANSAADKAIITHNYWGAEHTHNLLLILADLVLYSSKDFGVFLAETCDSITATDIFIVTNYLDEGMLSFARSKGYAAVTFLMLGKMSAGEIPDDILVYLLGGG